MPLLPSSFQTSWTTVLTLKQCGLKPVLPYTQAPNQQPEHLLGAGQGLRVHLDLLLSGSAFNTYTLGHLGLLQNAGHTLMQLNQNLFGHPEISVFRCSLMCGQGH